VVIDSGLLHLAGVFESQSTASDKNRVQAEDDHAIAFAEPKLLKRLPHDRKGTLTCKVSQ